MTRFNLAVLYVSLLYFGAVQATRRLQQDPTTTYPIIFLRPVYLSSDQNELPLTYNDKKSGASSDISVYTPNNVLTPNLPFKPLGSLAVNNYGAVADNLNWQNVWLASPGTPGALGFPVDYTLQWNDRSSGASMDGSVWRPSAPLGYGTLGDYWMPNYNKPANDAMYAIKQEAPQLIYADHGSGASMDGSIYTVGVSKIGIRSSDNFGTCRAENNYNPVAQTVAWNTCLKPECVKTIQLKDFTLASIAYDVSVIDPSKSKGTQFHHQNLINNSPGTLSSVVTGTKQTTKAVTMSFTTTVTNSITISEKIAIKASFPGVAEVTEETTITDGFTFQFADSQSSTTTVQETLTQTITVNVPAFSNLTVDMILSSQEDVEIPFTAKMFTSAYDWMTRSDAPTQQQITDILVASGFTGKILSYNAANHSLLVENNGVLKAAIATAVTVQITCTPIPGHETNCPRELTAHMPSPKGSDMPAKTLKATQDTAPLRAARGAEAPSSAGVPHNSVKYTLRLPSKLT